MGRYLAFHQRTGGRTNDLTNTSYQVEIWRILLTQSKVVDPDRAGLSLEERQRGARFHQARDRERYFRSHAALRAIVGHKLQIPAHAIRFETGANGKPRLATCGDQLGFNLAHAADFALVAMAEGIPVGIDVESDFLDIDVAAIASHFFTPVEQEIVNAASLADRKRVLLKIWTAKEAYVKGTGAGLSLAPEQVQVTMLDGDRFVAGEMRRPTSQWWVQSLRPASGYIGALATPAADPRIIWRDWP